MSPSTTSAKRLAAAGLDRVLDATVLPGYSRLGYALRGLGKATPPPLSGRRIIVTGASAGIGEAVSRELAMAGAEVHMLVRDAARGAAAADRVNSAIPAGAPGASPAVCDVSSLADVRRFADAWLGEHERLDALVHNAGVMPPARARSADGFELSFATNVLGPFLLTRLLLPGLRAAAPGRVITVSSGGMYTARLDPEDPQLERREYDGPAFYAHTKRAGVALSREWASRIPATAVAFHAMHPGWVDTPGLRTSLPRFHRTMKRILRTPRQGADTVVWLCSERALDPATGGFWHDRRPRSEHRVPWTRESAAERQRLWAYCERLTETPQGADAKAVDTQANTKEGTGHGQV
jgi:NAD(P)-dependent dehydrogenase (short-subunit alcohol dehydrogenase family)